MSAVKKKTRKDFPERSIDAPATQGMVFALKDVMNARFTSLEHEMNGRFASVHQLVIERFTALEHEMNSKFVEVHQKMDTGFVEVHQKMDAGFARTEARFETMEAKLDHLAAKVSEMAMQNEAQRSDNRVVLEGLQILFERQDRTESELKGMKTILREIAKSKRQARA